MKALEPLEKSLNDLFVKNAPELPKGGKDFLVQFLPWLGLIGAAVSAWAAWGIYEWTRAASVVSEWSRAFGVESTTTRWSVMLWISLIVILVTAVLYILAFAPLQAKKKAGWNLVFYALLLNVVYGVVSIFSDYGGGGTLIGSLIMAALGGWLLFQIRSRYTDESRPVPDKPKASD